MSMLAIPFPALPKVCNGSNVSSCDVVVVLVKKRKMLNVLLLSWGWAVLRVSAYGLCCGIYNI
jgi:hypothetical protein